MDAKEFLSALEDNGLLDHNFVGNFIDANLPSVKEKVNRTEADIAERKAKQEAKLARRAKRFRHD